MDRLAAVGKEGQSAQQTLDNALVQQTTAWKKGQVVYLSAASYLALGGVMQVKNDLTRIKDAFNQQK